MASSVIHMCVAKKINETLKIKDENMLLLGYQMRGNGI